MRKAIDAHQRRVEQYETGRCRVKVINQVRGIRAAAMNLVARSIYFKNLSACIREQEDPYITERVAGSRFLKELLLTVFIANLKTLHSTGFRFLAKSRF